MRNELKQAFRDALREYKGGKRKAQVELCYTCRFWEMLEPSLDGGRPVIEGECRYGPPAMGFLPVPVFDEPRVVRVGEDPGGPTMDLMFRSAPNVVPSGYGCAQHRPRGNNGVTLEAL